MQAEIAHQQVREQMEFSSVDELGEPANDDKPADEYAEPKTLPSESGDSVPEEEIIPLNAETEPTITEAVLSDHAEMHIVTEAPKAPKVEITEVIAAPEFNAPEPETFGEPIAGIGTDPLTELDLPAEPDLLEDAFEIADLTEEPEFRILSDQLVDEVAAEPFSLEMVKTEATIEEQWSEVLETMEPEVVEAVQQLSETITVILERLPAAGPVESAAIEEVLIELCTELLAYMGMVDNPEIVKRFVASLTDTETPLRPATDAMLLEEGTHEQRHDDTHFLNTLLQFIKQKAAQLHLLGSLAVRFGFTPQMRINQ